MGLIVGLGFGCAGVCVWLGDRLPLLGDPAHEEMVQSINAGDAAAAIAGIEHHLGNALQRSLNVFQDGTT